MDCEKCLSLLSDLIDGSLPPRVLEAVNGHIASCPSCGLELRRMKEALSMLHAVAREEPPPALLAATAARVAAAHAAVASSASASRHAGARRWRACAAAAAILLVAVVLVAIARERTWRSRLESARVSARDEAAQLRVDAAELRTALVAAQKREVEAAEAERAARDAAENRSSALERRIAQLEEKAAKDAADLRESLAAARAEVKRLGLELTRATEQKPPAPPPVSPAQPRSSPPAPPAGDRSLAARSPAAPQRERDNVVIVDRGNRLELKVRSGSSRQAVVEELFSIADNRANPATASLALSTLENLLAGSRTRPRSDEGAAQEGGSAPWSNRRIDRFAEGLGIRSTNEAAAPPSRTDARLRLNELKEAWQREKESGTE